MSASTPTIRRERNAPATSPAAPAQPRWPVSRSVRRSLLTVHIVASVSLLGDSAGFLAVAVRGATTDDPALAASSYELLEMFSIVFGIPLSMIALASGLALGCATKWGVLRHWWVMAKLLLVVSVIVVGALVIGPSLALMQDGTGGRETALILAPAWQVLALLVATGLSVFKPGGRRGRARVRVRA